MGRILTIESFVVIKVAVIAFELEKRLGRALVEMRIERSGK